MYLPEGCNYERKIGERLKLEKALYGLKQASFK